MISVSEARQLVINNARQLAPVLRDLENSLGHVLAEDLWAGADFPPFEQSAMDGYAICFSDYKTCGELSIQGESAAGLPMQMPAGKNKAVRIFTGAPLPANTDTVVIQEKVQVQDNQLKITDDLLIEGSNVRLAGSEIRKGERALEKGTLLTPPAIGWLASIGFSEIPVVAKPTTGLIITGKELQGPGKPLAYGQVYESNSFSLQAALRQLGMPADEIHWVDDDLAALEDLLSASIRNHDLILITGGISVGDYDYVARALTNCGVNRIFHKVKQKPGKPLYFGRKENCLVFALPGNPSSVLTCFYEYVLEALQIMSGQRNGFIKTSVKPILKAFSKKPGLTHFLKGKLMEEGVLPLDAQESYRLRSFALADCLIVLEEQETNYELYQPVTVHRLPG